MKDKPFLVLSGLFFLLFLGGMMMFAMTQTGPSTILKATNAAVSPLKSFVIVFPQVASAGTKIKVTVTLRDVNGVAIPSRSVQLASSSIPLSITPVNIQVTDENGQAQFFITSNTAGTAQLTATELSGNVSIVNIPTAQFTK